MIRLLRHGKPVAVLMVIIAFSFSAPVCPAFGALVGTDSANPQRAPDVRDRLTEFLARDEVKLQLRLLGIDPAEAEARVACLSASELEALSGRIDSLPAGGMGSITPPWYMVVIPLAIVAVVVAVLIYLGYWGYQKSKELEAERGAPLPDPRMTRLPNASPYPPRAIVPPVLTLSETEPWTGKWKVTTGRLAGVWALKQEGNRVTSTRDSDFLLDATVTGNAISGQWSDLRQHGRSSFTAVLSEDGRSFKAELPTVPRFEASKIE